MHSNETPNDSLWELYDIQKANEDLALDWTQERYQRRCKTKGGKERPLGDLPVGIALIRDKCDSVAKRIDEELEDVTRGTARVARKWLKDCSLDSHTMAYIALKVCISSIGRQLSYQNICHKIYTNVFNEIELRKFHKEAPQYLAKVEENLRLVREQRHRHTVLLRAKRKIGIADDARPVGEATVIGLVLLEVVVAETQLFYRGRSRKDAPYKLLPTDELLAFIRQGHHCASLFAPISLPMVIPPLPWLSDTDGFDGGYLTRRTGLVRTRGRRYDPGPKGYDPRVLEAVNKVQETPWRINKGVLGVLEELIQGNSPLGNLPSTVEIPDCPWEWGEEFKRAKVTDPDAVKAWKKERLIAHKTNIQQNTKIIAMKIQLEIADRFKEFDQIYFPHFLDWRGRMYPYVIFLNPQGDDKAKALLEFAEGKPLDSPEAIKWFLVHGANCFGHDKCSFDDRMAWANSHHSQIMDSGLNPLDGQRFWTEASEPFKFLAWCMEFAEFYSEDTVAEDFRSHLPISMDGTCSGLQHYSALLRDESGGLATNLVPSDAPSDIYQEVADVCQSLVTRELKSKDKDERHWARVWDGLITRNVAKRNTMTVPYGVTNRGMCQQLFQLFMKGDIEFTNGCDNPWKACVYLAGKMETAISQVVLSSQVGKKFLQETARLLSTEGRDIGWTTPIGFKVTQRYRNFNKKRVQTYIGTALIRMQIIAGQSDKVDKRKAANGLSPNFIHSLDAAHLMSTVIAMPKDSSLCVVHDSFGCHASDVETLRANLRVSFADQYEDRNLLDEFLDEQPLLDSEGNELEYPELPPMGELNVAEIAESDYLFS